MSDPPRDLEEERDHWRRLYYECEAQRDHWTGLFREAEGQRDRFEADCRDAQAQIDHWHGLHGEAASQRDRLRDLLDQSATQRRGFSELDYSLPFDHVLRCGDAPAALSMRERIFLYAIVYSLAPQNALEVGTFKGGSAQIISGALDDLGLGGKLLTVDPSPEQIEIEWDTIAHNTTQLPGFFPKDFKSSSLAKGIRFDFAFIDGDHGFKGLGQDLKFLHRALAPGAYVLLHDAYNPGVEQAIDVAVKRSGYRDCGRIGRAANDLAEELFGGFHLLSWQ